MNSFICLIFSGSFSETWLLLSSVSLFNDYVSNTDCLCVLKKTDKEKMNKQNNKVLNI